MAAFGCAASLFVVAALAIWGQLTIGWQWSPPDTLATTSAMVLMTVAVAVLGVVLVVGALPIVWVAVRALASASPWRLARPLGLCVAGVAVLVVGTHHFANGWPGTGGHPWSHQGVVPGGVAAYAWASTLFVTSYWLHPAALGQFPAPEVAWMVASPLAALAAVIGAAKVVRRMQLSARVLRFERGVGLAAAAAMTAFFAGAALWVLDGGPGPRNLFHIGAIDVLELVVMGVSLALAGRAVGRADGGVRTVAAH